MSQLDLFSAPVTRGSHRRTSRQTSVDAARSMSGDTLTNQQRLVLTRLSWAVDANAYEVASELGLQQNVVCRRFNDLESMRLAERTGTKREGSSGRQGDCWRATRRGVQWLSGQVDVDTGDVL